MSVAFIVLSVLFGLIPQCFAEDPMTPPEESVIHPKDIQEFFDRYIAENNLSSDLISVGYIYTATGTHQPAPPFQVLCLIVCLDFLHSS